MEIRPVDAADPREVEAAGAVVREGYFALDHYPHDDGYDHEIGAVDERLDTVVLVAVDDGEVVACLTYIADPRHPLAEHGDDEAATFRFFAVSPVAQGRGVGEAMVRAVIDRARADGRRRIRMHTLTMMHGAMRLYERLGFVRDPAHDETWDDVVGLGYVLHLDAAACTP